MSKHNYVGKFKGLSNIHADNGVPLKFKSLPNCRFLELRALKRESAHSTIFRAGVLIKLR